jgi:hypothetical protein
MVQSIMNEEAEKWQEAGVAQQDAVNEVEKELREYVGGRKWFHVALIDGGYHSEVL